MTSLPLLLRDIARTEELVATGRCTRTSDPTVSCIRCSVPRIIRTDISIHIVAITTIIASTLPSSSSSGSRNRSAEDALQRRCRQDPRSVSRGSFCSCSGRWKRLRSWTLRACTATVQHSVSSTRYVASIVLQVATFSIAPSIEEKTEAVINTSAFISGASSVIENECKKRNLSASTTTK